MGDAKVSMFNSSKVLHLRVRLLVGRVLAVLWPFFGTENFINGLGAIYESLDFQSGGLLASKAPGDLQSDYFASTEHRPAIQIDDWTRPP
jgi:hypothetical protein